MKVTKDKASATLTDVKNKIGDVFSLVDDFGEVTITSYNKPTYKIVKIPPERKAALKKEQKEEKKPEADDVEITESETAEPEKKAVTASAKASVPAKKEQDIEPIVPETPSTDEVIELDVPEEGDKQEEISIPTADEVIPVPATPAPVAADIPVPPPVDTDEQEPATERVTDFQPPAEFAGLLQEEADQSAAITEDQADEDDAIGTEDAGSIVETVAISNKTSESRPAAGTADTGKEWDRAGHLEQDWVQKVRNLL